MNKTILPGLPGGRLLAGPMTARELSRGRFLRDYEGHPNGAAHTKSVEQLAAEIKASIEAKHSDVMKVSEAALTEAKNAGVVSAETKAKFDEQLYVVNTLREMVAQIEQKMAQGGKPESGIKSLGAQVVESDKYVNWKASGFSGNMKIQLKTVTAANAGAVSDRQLSDPIPLPQRELTIRDLLSVIPTSLGSVDYAKQTLRTNNAAPVAEGAAKPYSDYAWGQATAVIRTIAHLAKITRQALDDVPQLQGRVDKEMRYGLALIEEAQLLNGDGTGQNLSGLIINATAYASPITYASPTRLDQLRLALAQAEVAMYPSDGIVLNSADFAGIELIKDSAGFYVWANPQEMGAPRLWGKPVVKSLSMPIGKFLVGGFKLQVLYDRMEPEVLISSENVDDFEKNLYTMRCEERIGLAVERPGALIYGTLV